ncbi:TPA: hypothetical protein ACKQAW_000993 [Stenotrophomonas maltophilia]
MRRQGPAVPIPEWAHIGPRGRGWQSCR